MDKICICFKRAMLKRIKELKTSRPEIISYKHLDNFFQAVNSRSFSDLILSNEFTVYFSRISHIKYICKNS